MVRIARLLSDRFLAGCVHLGWRRAHWVLALMGVLWVLSVVAMVHHLSVDSKLEALISEDLPFQQRSRVYKAAFPELDDSFVFVVDGLAQELNVEAARSLERKLGQDAHFRDVLALQTDPFLLRNGLLFLELGEVETVIDRLSQSQPFLALLRNDPGVAGLLSTLAKLTTELEGRDLGNLAIFARIVNEGLERSLEGRHDPVSWMDGLGEALPVAETGRVLVVARPTEESGRVFDLKPSMRRAAEIAREVEAESVAGLRVRITGTNALRYEELDTVFRGSTRAALLSATMVLLVLGFLFRSGGPVLLTLGSLALGLSYTGAIAGLLFEDLNMISITFAVLYIGLGVDYAIHFLLWTRDLRGRGLPAEMVVDRTTRVIGISLMLCSVSTGIGFLSFVPSDYVGVSQLGIISAVGVIVSLLVTLLFIPAMIRLLPALVGRRGRTLPQSRRVFHAAERCVRRYPVGVVCTFGVLLAVGVLLVPSARFDHDPMNLRSPDSETVQAMLELIAERESTYWAAVSLAEGAAQARALADELKSLETVHEVRSIFSFVPDDQDEKLMSIGMAHFIVGDTLDLRDIDFSAVDVSAAVAALEELCAALQGDKLGALEDPEDRRAFQELAQSVERLRGRPAHELDAPLRLLRDNLFNTLVLATQRLDMLLEAQPYTMDEVPQRIARLWVAPGDIWRLEIIPQETPETAARLQAFIDSLRTVDPAVTGHSVGRLEAGNAVVRAFRISFAVALAGIICLLLILTRSVWDSLLILAPLVLAGVYTVGFSAATGIPFNFANVIVLPLLLGLGVDNGIHLVHRWRSGEIGGPELLRTSTARAVLYSSLTTTVSFVNLAFIGHRGLESMGILLAVGLLFIAVTTLLGLPALITILERLGVAGRPPAALAKGQEAMENAGVLASADSIPSSSSSSKKNSSSGKSSSMGGSPS